MVLLLVFLSGLVLGECPDWVSLSEQDWAIDMTASGADQAIKKIMASEYDDFVFIYSDTNGDSDWSMFSKMWYNQTVEWQVARELVANPNAV